MWKKRFEKEGFDVEVKHLSIGDFFLPEKNIVFEHKSVSDFCNSIVSGHLQKQLIQQEKNFEKGFLLITGCWKEFVRFSHLKIKNKEYITGFLAHLRHYKKTVVLPVEFDTFVPQVIKKIYEKSDDELNIRDTELLRAKLSGEDFKVRLLCSFDNVGRKRAEKYLECPDIHKAIDVFISMLEKTAEDWGIKDLSKIIKKCKEKIVVCRK